MRFIDYVFLFGGILIGRLTFDYLIKDRLEMFLENTYRKYVLNKEKKQKEKRSPIEFINLKYDPFADDISYCKSCYCVVCESMSYCPYCGKKLLWEGGKVKSVHEFPADHIEAGKILKDQITYTGCSAE